MITAADVTVGTIEMYGELVEDNRGAIKEHKAKAKKWPGDKG